MEQNHSTGDYNKQVEAKVDALPAAHDRRIWCHQFGIFLHFAKDDEYYTDFSLTAHSGAQWIGQKDSKMMNSGLESQH